MQTEDFLLHTVHSAATLVRPKAEAFIITTDLKCLDLLLFHMDHFKQIFIFGVILFTMFHTWSTMNLRLPAC